MGLKKTNVLLLLYGLFFGACLSLMLLLTPTPTNAVAGINKTINFQGRLLNSQGAVVPDGFYNIEFKIYQDGDGQSVGNTTGSPSGSLKWTEDHLNNASNGVRVVNGFLSVELGSVNAFGSNVDWNQDTLWLSMNIGSTASCTPFSSCSPDGEMVPMQRLTAAPYAMNAGQLGGLQSSNFVQLAQGIQTDTSTANASIAINKNNASGTPNILQLQKASADVLVVDNSGSATFYTDTNFTYAGTENMAVTSDLAGSVDVVSVVGTPSSTAGTTRGIFVQQANSANTNGLDNGIVVDNADADLAVTNGINITNSGGGGYTNFINTGSGTFVVNGSGAVTAADLTCASASCISTGEITDGTITGDDINSSIAGAGLVLTAGSPDVLDVVSGNAGIIVNANDISLDATVSGDGNSSTTSSGSGLEVIAGQGLTLLAGCSDAQILKWNETTDVWACSADSDSGATTTLQTAYNNDVDGGDSIIQLSSADDGIIIRNPSSSGSDSTYNLTIDQLDTGAHGGLSIQSAGTGNLLLVTDTTATARDVLTIADGGATTFRNQTNSSSAFQVLTSGGTVLYNIDTTGNTISTGITGSTNANSTVHIADSSAGVQTVTIGSTNSTSATNINGGSGAVNVLGLTKINNSGTANTTIGNSAGGTITIGASSGSDLALQDADWSVTGAGAANFATVSAGTVTSTGDLALSATGANTGSITKRFLVGASGINQFDVVVMTTTPDIQQTTTARDPTVYGVSKTTTAAAGTATIAISGNYTVSVDTGAVAIGDQLVTSTVAGLATVDNNATTGIIGRALSSKVGGANGTVSIYIRPVNGQYTPTIRAAASSTTAFQVQNSSGTNFLAVDTTGNIVNIGITGSTNTNSTIHVADSSAGVQTVTIGSTNSTSATTINAGSGGVTVNGNVTQSGAGTFNTGTGSVSLNGDTTVASGKNFTQSGGGTFSTGTGANSLNGDTTIANNKNFTQTGGGTFTTGSGTNTLSGNTTVSSGKTFNVAGGASTFTGNSGGNTIALTVNTGNATNVGATIVGASSQTGNLFQLQDSSSSNLTVADATGDLDVASGYVSTAHGGVGKYSNLIQYSEQFDQSGTWAQSNITSVTANDGSSNPAPDGNTTADKIISSGSGTHSLTNTYTTANNGDYTFSVWVKTNSGTQPIQLRVDSSNASPNTGTAASFTATTTWQRFVVSQNFTGTPTNIKAVLIISNDSATVVAWGGQLVTGTAAQVYTRTSTNTVTATGGVVDNGTALFQSSTNSTSAFQIQTNTNTNLFAVDTSGSIVNVGITGSTNANSTIHIADSSAGVQTVSIGSINSTSATTLNAGSGGLTFNGNTTISGAFTFATGTGAVNLNGDVTIASGKNFTQSGGGTFTTGTGTNTLSGDTTLASGKSFNQVGGGTFTTGSGANTLKGNTSIDTDKTFTANGTSLFKSATNSSTAFQIQTNGSVNMFGVDTIGNSVTIGVTGAINANSAVHVADSSSGIQTVTVGSTSSTSGTTIQAGSSGLTLNADTTLSSGKNFTQAGSGTFSTGTGANSLNGDTSIASNKSFTANGTALFKSATNSSTALQVQNSTGSNLLSADTINRQVSHTSGVDINSNDALTTAYGGLSDSYSNLVSGFGSFEGGVTTGWNSQGTNTLAASSTQALFGSNSAKATYSNDFRLMVSNSFTLSATTTYVFSAYVYIPSDFNGSGIDLGDDGTFTGATGKVSTDADMNLRDQWQRVTLRLTTASGVTGGFYIRTLSAPTVGKFIYIDGMQVTQGRTIYPYNPLTSAIGGGLTSDGQLTGLGSALFHNIADSTTAFQVQNTSSQNLLAIDTTSNIVNIGVVGSTSANSTIHVADSTAGIQTITIGSTSSSSAATIKAGSGGITLTGNTTISGSSTFDSGTGAVNLNGDVTVASGKNFNQAGAGTFGTGTGAVSLRGDTTVSNGKELVFGSNTSDLTCNNGAIFYRSDTNRFRGCENGTWIYIDNFADVQTYTSGDNTWTKPTNASAVQVILVAGGGGGGGGGSKNGGSERNGGGAGGGGAYASQIFAAADLGSTAHANVGTAGSSGGGASGNGVNGTAGGVGGDSCFSSAASCGGTVYSKAYGGGGGAGGGGAAPGLGGGGGGGGAAAAGSNSTTITGGTGGNPLGASANNGSAGGSGAGGGSGNGGTANPGNAGGSAEYGGGGGGGSAGGNAASGAGGGSLHGAGGGGSGASINSGNSTGTGGAGGISQTATSGGGAAAGTSGSACASGGNATNGGTGTSIKAGGGGGGGGANGGGGGVGCTGGNGGAPGGAGGGGGAGTASAGAGGTGAAGEIWVISW